MSLKLGYSAVAFNVSHTLPAQTNITAIKMIKLRNFFINVSPYCE